MEAARNRLEALYVLAVNTGGRAGIEPGGGDEFGYFEGQQNDLWRVVSPPKTTKSRRSIKM